MAKIPREKIDQIVQSTDIVETISQYMTLKPRGKNFFGNCPFHNEKTPSFSVNPEKQIFYCFGCQKGGNVLTFVMEYEKLGFLEAVRMLAQKAGIVLEYDQQDAAQYKEKEALFETTRFAARYFYRNLVSTKAGKIGLDYFKKRMLDEQIIKKFGLGYAVESWDGLIKAAQRKAIKIELLEKTGLAIPRKNAGGFYDRFRNRVIFPIFDASGRVVAFGGRRMVEDNTPKYINSPETMIYQKREILYGLAQTRQAIQQAGKVIMVEGYMDLISLFQSGIQNVVATSGTALTAEHAKLISRYTKNAVLLYDGDSAGSNAALRGLDILLENDLDVMVTKLPEGHDPDSFVKGEGVEVMHQKVDAALPLVEFKVSMIGEKEDLSSPAGKTRAIHSILESVIKIKDEIKRNVTIRDVAERFFLDERLLLRELEQLKKSSNKYKTVVQTATGNNVAPAVRLPSPKKEKKPADRAEIALTQLLLRNEQIYDFVFVNLDTNKIKHPKLKEIIEILHLMQQKKRLDERHKLITYFQDSAIASFIAKALDVEVTNSEDRRLAEDCIIQIEIREIDVLLEELQMQIREYSKEGKNTSLVSKKWQELVQLKKDVKLKKFLKYPKKT